MTEHGDERGLLWSQNPVVTRSSKRDGAPKSMPPAPDWTPPEDFPSFKQRPRIGLDIEGHDPDLEKLGPGVRRDGCITGVALALTRDEAAYYPVAHEPGPNLDPDKVFGWLREEGASFTGEIVGTNLTYDLDYLAEQGVVFPHAKLRDVQVADKLLDENHFTYNLDDIAKRDGYGGKVTDELEKLYGKGYIKRMKDLHPGHVAAYAEGDVTLPWQLMDEQQDQMRHEGLDRIFDIESRVTPLLLAMRRNGVRVDIERGKVAEEDLLRRLKEAHNDLPRPTDIWAADSVAKLFDMEGLDYPKTEKTGKPSFKRPWLEAHPHALAKQIVKVRALDKILNPFLSNYILGAGALGRVHGTFNQQGARTGRLSSGNPNLQNIPVRDPELGPLLRSLFIPEEDMLWGCADWSQIEFRFLVHYGILAMNAVPGMCRSAFEAAEMYRNDPTTDFHAMAAALTGLERGPSKNINFGVVYGMGKDTMAAAMGCTVAEAAPVLATFHEELPFIKEIYDMASNRARKRQEIITILGRKRRFPGGNLNHKALNALLQGSAADLMKKAMVQMWEGGLFNVLVPHLTVHDEMDVSIPRTKAGREAWGELVNIMQTAMTLEVPVLASANTGLDWYDAK